MLIWLSILLFIMTTWLSGYALAGILSRWTPFPTIDRIIMALPLGGWSIAWALFCGNALAGVPVTAPLVTGLLLVGAGTGLVWLMRDRFKRRPRLDNRHNAATMLDRPWSKWTYLFAGVMAILLCRQFLEAWVSPIRNNDALGYHLPYAKLIYQTHALPQFAGPNPTDSWAAYPPLLFVYYAMEWLWLDAVHLFLPRMLPMVFTFLIIVLLYRITHRVLGASSTVSVVVSMTILLPGNYTEGLSLYQSNADVPFAFWTLATVYFLMRDLSEKTTARWLLVGLCGAMACWTKPFGFPFGVVCAGVLILSAAGSRLRRSSVWPYDPRAIAKLIGVWGALVVPFLLRNYLYWDNPVYPGFGRIFGGHLIDEWSLKQYTFFAGSMPLFFDWQEILAGAFREPAVALAAPLILHPAVRREPSLRTAWLIAMGYLALYLVKFGSPMMRFDHVRYLLPAFVIFSMFMAIFLDRQYRTVSSMLPVLVCALGIQAIRLLYDGIQSPLSPVPLSHIKALAYELFPVLIVLGFLVLTFRRFERLATIDRLRPGMIAVSCLVLTANWPLTKPWRIVTQPLVAHPEPVDWTAVPLVEPFGPWIHEHLPESAVLLIRYGGRWVIPRAMVDADSALMKAFHDPSLPEDRQLEILARLGVTHVCEGTMGLGAVEPIRLPCWKDLDRVPFLRRIYEQEYQANRFTVYEVVYPGRLRSVVDAPAPRPWLYERAAVGILINFDHQKGQPL